jgi:predicted Rossmann fold flavoprotein
VKLKIEEDGRVFPVTDSSETIIKCLLSEAERFKVKILTGVSITSITPEAEKIRLQLNNHNNNEPVFDKVIVATGGNPSLNSYAWLKQLGHTIIPPVPSLFTFNVPDNPFEGLMGIVINPVTLKIKNTFFSETGPLLFTHWGLSGPAVLKLSAWGARWMADKNYEFNVMINFTGVRNEQVVRDELIQFINSDSKKLIFSKPFIDLPSRLWIRICELSGITENKSWSGTGKAHINNLIRTLTISEVSIKGKTTFKEEFVTCGGIKLSEVNFSTMESRIIKNLFFAGEVLDIDGITGGFNFQSAWTTGWIAGNTAGGK